MKPSCRRQRGNVLVLASLALAVAMACLMVLDVAHVFTVKRELQKVADLAALAGARLPRDCAAMQARAEASARANAHLPGVDRQARFECGSWDSASGFAASAAAPSALRATVSRHVPYFFMAGGSRRIEAQAVARNDAFDVFSLGTGLASLHAGALNALLGAISGSSVHLDLVAYQGLAATGIRLGDLVGATLEVGTLQELLDSEVRLADMVLAMARAADGSSPLSASVLDSLALQLPPGLGVQLGQVLDVQLPTSDAAAAVRISALQLLLAAAQFATGDALLDLAASIPPNALGSVGMKLRILEPPRIAIGAEGVQARSGQVRLLMDLRTSSIALPAGVASASGLYLPLYVEAAAGVATLRRMECEAQASDCAVEIDVQGGPARGCVAAAAADLAAAGTGCGSPAELMAARVTLLGIPAAEVRIRGRAVTSLASGEAQRVRFGRFGFGASSVTDSHWTGSTSASDSVAGLLGDLPGALVLDPQVQLLGLHAGGTLDASVQALVARVEEAVAHATTSVLQPLLSDLGDPLLQVLGVRAGITDLHQIQLHCGHAELVQ